MFTKLRPALRRSHYHHQNHRPHHTLYTSAPPSNPSTHVSQESDTRAAMSTATVNGGDKGMAASKQQHQQLRSSSSGKGLDGARKQAPSPVDGQNNK